MNTVFLIIGGNLGDRQHNLNTAVHLIGQKTGIVKRLSAVYETEPWGAKDQPDYHNQVVEITTKLKPEYLMQLLLDIEQKMGRVRTQKYSARIIDIDILFYDDQIINNPLVTIPHPKICERRFVLEPINEIAPEFVHPVLQKTIAALLTDCPDNSTVKKI